MSDVVVIGCAGQVGQELMDGVFPPHLDVYGFDRDVCDITDPDAVDRLVAEQRPSLLVNAAAYTAVDKSESDEAGAFAINRDGPANLARSAERHGAALLHLSTDYVFDGTQQGAYAETDPVQPLGVYGRSKEAGEAAVRDALARHVIVRTAWVFGRHGGNFVKTMLRVGAERDELRVVADQHGGPTPARAIARMLATIGQRIIADPKTASYGTFHYTGAPATNWHAFAEAIFASAGRRGHKVPTVQAITSAEYPTPAKRPENSVLSMAAIDAAYGIKPADWQRELEDVIDAILGSPVA